MHTTLRLIIMILIALSPSLLMADSRQDLLPRPAHVSPQEGALRLEPSFCVNQEGPASPRVTAALFRTLRRLSGRTGLMFAQDPQDGPPHAESPTLNVRYRQGGRLDVGTDESYVLSITPSRADLEAPTDLGILRGLESFLQLLEPDGAAYRFPSVRIEDAPRFPWRGLMLDVCRHFLPVEVVKRNLDAMAAARLNVLHWHLSEDQGFRVECRSFPQLHGRGSDGLFYTQEQIREVVAYAAERGIRVVPEFDIPGHCSSWMAGYPELASAPGPYRIERQWGVFDPAFDPTNRKVYRFFERFFREMSTLFPDSYLHIGGDENNGHQWQANPVILAFMKKEGLKDTHELQAHFNRKIASILGKLGKRPVGWDEVLAAGMPANLAIQSWRGKDSLYDAARKGFDGILSSGYYIDLMEPASRHYANDPLPADAGLTPDQARHILGGEATMWAEWVTPENVDSRIWPRTAAIAERLWSPREVQDPDDLYRRLDIFATGLEELGLTHRTCRDVLLRRMTGGNVPPALCLLADAVSPVKGYQRGTQLGVNHSFFPLTRLVDAALPDAPWGRALTTETRAFLGASCPETRQALRMRLAEGSANHGKLGPLFARLPILAPYEPVSRALSTACSLGLEAMNLQEGGTPAPPGWREKVRQQIQECRRPSGEVELGFLDALETLLTSIP